MLDIPESLPVFFSQFRRNIGEIFISESADEKCSLDNVPAFRQHSIPLRIGFQLCLLIADKGDSVLVWVQSLDVPADRFLKTFKAVFNISLTGMPARFDYQNVHGNLLSEPFRGGNSAPWLVDLIQAHADCRNNFLLARGEVCVVCLDLGQACDAETLLFKACQRCNQAAEGA